MNIDVMISSQTWYFNIAKLNKKMHFSYLEEHRIAGLLIQCSSLCVMAHPFPENTGEIVPLWTEQWCMALTKYSAQVNQFAKFNNSWNLILVVKSTIVVFIFIVLQIN